MRTYIIMSLLLLCSATQLISQNPEWIVFDSSNSPLPNNVVYRVVIDSSDNKWFASDGFVKYNNHDWFHYSDSGLGLFNDRTNAMAVDKHGNLWASSDKGGLDKFDGNKWTHIRYLPKEPNFDYDNILYTLTIDVYDNLWSGTFEKVLKYDGEKWSSYIDSTLYCNETVTISVFDVSGIMWVGYSDIIDGGRGLMMSFDGSNWTRIETDGGGITEIEIDKDQTKWIGYIDPAGMVKYNSSELVRYTTTNSKIPNNYVHSIAIDDKNVKWIATECGLAKFDGTNWTTYNKSNSGLPNNFIFSVEIDKYGNKWMATNGGGVAVFREGGVILDVDDQSNANAPEGLSVSPNPARDYIVVSLSNRRLQPSATEASYIGIYNILGEKVLSVSIQNLESQRIDVSHLPPGLYYCTLSIGTNKITKSFMVVK